MAATFTVQQVATGLARPSKKECRVVKARHGSGGTRAEGRQYKDRPTWACQQKSKIDGNDKFKWMMDAGTEMG